MASLKQELPCWDGSSGDGRRHLAPKVCVGVWVGIRGSKKRGGVFLSMIRTMEKSVALNSLLAYGQFRHAPRALVVIYKYMAGA